MTEALARMTPERRAFLLAVGGGAAALVIAVVLFTRFSLGDNFWRDEAIYAYGGQQLADGVPLWGRGGVFPPGGPPARRGRAPLQRHLRPEAAAAALPRRGRRPERAGG